MRCCAVARWHQPEPVGWCFESLSYQPCKQMCKDQWHESCLSACMADGTCKDSIGTRQRCKWAESDSPRLGCHLLTPPFCMFNDNHRPCFHAHQPENAIGETMRFNLELCDIATAAASILIFWVHQLQQTSRWLSKGWGNSKGPFASALTLLQRHKFEFYLGAKCMSVLQNRQGSCKGGHFVCESTSNQDSCQPRLMSPGWTCIHRQNALIRSTAFWCQTNAVSSLRSEEGIPQTDEGQERCCMAMMRSVTNAL